MNRTETEQRPARTLKDYVGLAARGFAMGAADVVPGVSGGTMAFILGIYEELINAIRSITSLETIKLALGFKIKGVFQAIPWQFLLAVGIGILVAILSLASFLEWALQNHPVLLWAFFFGLVLASIITVSRRVKQWGGSIIISLVFGTIFGYFIVGLVPVQTPDAPWFLFLSGAIAICAMILPGISGSFILVLLGKYETILGAVNDRDILTLFFVAAGAAVGITTIAQVLGWLFKRYHDITVAFLIGLMIGSLRKIWPWKETLETVIDRHGEEIPVVQVNILPPAWNGEVMSAILLAIIGFIVVLALDYWALRQPNAQAE